MKPLKNVTPNRRKILGMIARNGAVTPGDAAALASTSFQKIGDKPPTSAVMWGTAYLKNMEEAGLIRIVSRPKSSKRKNLINKYEMTEAGKQEYSNGCELPLFQNL